ncbi:hypothetical protein [Novosphingobium sp. 11B]
MKVQEARREAGVGFSWPWPFTVDAQVMWDRGWRASPKWRGRERLQLALREICIGVPVLNTVLSCFHAKRRCVIFRFGKALHMQDVDHVEPAEEAAPPSPRAADWFWHPWYAKLYLALALLYWIGLELMITIPYDRLNIYLVNTMVLVIFVFNPVTVIAALGYGFLKAKVACGEWVITPGPPSQSPLIDPYTDPFDCRSGDIHLQHIGVIKC